VGLVAPGVLVLDRTDSSGVSTPTTREYITYTDISVNQITGVTRGVAGSSAQAHSSGSIVEETMSVTHWGDLLSFLKTSHDTAGNIVLSSLATMAILRVYTDLNISGASFTASSVRILQAINATGASITTTGLRVLENLDVTGASFAGLPIHPVWIFSASASSVSSCASPILHMPQAGSFSWFSVGLDNFASGASYIFNVMKNGSSIFDAVNRPTVAGGGTFVSTASIATKSFVAGDQFWIDIVGMAAQPVDVVVQAKG
jgi:hypothetical protein